MKTTALSLLTFIYALFVVSCGQHSEDGTEHETDATQHEHEQVDHDHGHGHDGHDHHDETDHQGKWKANRETTEGINKMNEFLHDYDDKNASAYKALRDSLLIEYQLIFKNCTMKGEAHDELHSYLTPLAPMFDKLTAGNQDTSNYYFERIKLHLEDYDLYFE